LLNLRLKVHAAIKPEMAAVVPRTIPTMTPVLRVAGLGELDGGGVVVVVAVALDDEEVDVGVGRPKRETAAAVTDACRAAFAASHS
jgi:hypothetical protein